MRLASKHYAPDFLATCTLYTSTEPCAMCSGAIYGDDPANPTMHLPCRVVLSSGQKEIEVMGPLLEEEAAQVHEGFWR